MAKISPVSTKYIIRSTINIDGAVERPDVIGAIFGQTEGLLGSDLELRELQRSGKIGRIEVEIKNNGPKAQGEISIPSSLDKAETAIIAAAMEVIQRIGPCNAEIKIKGIEDVRISKRNFVVTRAKDILKNMIESHMPDSTELAEEVAQSVRVAELTSYGPEKLSCGPALQESDDIIIVEGRADVVTLLKHGFKNAIAMNGSMVPKSIIELTKTKEVTVFVDGDRGGELNIRNLINTCDIDHIVKAPEGKEVEELTKKEIHKLLRSKYSVAAWLNEFGGERPKKTSAAAANQRALRQKERSNSRYESKSRTTSKPEVKRDPRFSRTAPKPAGKSDEAKSASSVDPNRKNTYKKYLEQLIGSRAAVVLDSKDSELAKVPFVELPAALKGLDKADTIVFDGGVNTQLIKIAEKNKIKTLVCMSSRIKSTDKVKVVTSENL